jgi:hypothetical protein
MGGKDPLKTPSKEAPPRRFSFNPVWLVDVAGFAGLAAFAWSVGWAEGSSWAAYETAAREAGLILFGCALVVRALGWTLHLRDGRGQARRELARRLIGVNEALFELRRSLSRDNTRAFLDRRSEFVAGAKLAARWLNEEETRLAKVLTEFCDRLGQALGSTVHRRLGVTGLADRLSREIDRAARRGDLDHNDADNLLNLIDDAVAVMDEAIYADWNADHFGRLSADSRAFAREIERYSAPIADQIERHGQELFGLLIEHVNRKVEVVDLILDWDEEYRKLELRLAGVNPGKVLSMTGRKARAAAPRPKLADRFAGAPPSEAPSESDHARLRQSAAND